MMKKPKFKEAEPIQGLYSIENPNGSFWFLKSKIALAKFQKINLNEAMKE